MWRLAATPLRPQWFCKHLTLTAKISPLRYPLEHTLRFPHPAKKVYRSEICATRLCRSLMNTGKSCMVQPLLGKQE